MTDRVLISPNEPDRETQRHAPNRHRGGRRPHRRRVQPGLDRVQRAIFGRDQAPEAAIPPVWTGQVTRRAVDHELQRQLADHRVRQRRCTDGQAWGFALRPLR